jgi:NO-binding membrane sensor protein with MHYT domain
MTGPVRRSASSHAPTSIVSASPNRLLGAVAGAGLLTLGILGFLFASAGFLSRPGATLWGAFTTNGLQSLLHCLVGAALLLAAVSTLDASRRVNGVVGALLLGWGLSGLFLIDTAANIFALDEWSNLSHFAASCVLLAVGLGVERPERPAA